MTYEYQNLNRPEMRKYITAAATRLLDVGCNTGTFGAGLKATREIEVWGVEPNLNAAAKASTILDQVLNCYFNEHTEAPSNYFDVVSFNDVLEHLHDPWAALQLAKTKLRNGGIVVASVPNLLNKENLVHMLIGRDFRYEDDGIRDRTHLRFFTQKSVRRTFEECGYDVLSVEGINEAWYSSSLFVRSVYRLFAKQLQETKFRQIAIVAKSSD